MGSGHVVGMDDGAIDRELLALEEVLAAGAEGDARCRNSLGPEEGLKIENSLFVSCKLTFLYALSSI